MLHACFSGDLPEVKRLFQEDPKLLFQLDKEGLTPLMVAITEAKADVAEYLANVSDAETLQLQDSIGNRALHYAVYCRALWLVKILVEERGCNVIDTKTPKTTNRAIHLSVMTGSLPITIYLLERGATLEDVVECGPGIIWSSVVQDRANVFEYLFNRILEKNKAIAAGLESSTSSSSSPTASQPSSTSSKEETASTSDVPSINPARQTTGDGTDLFWHAVSWGSTKIVKWLIQNQYASWKESADDHGTAAPAEYPIGQLPKVNRQGIVVTAALNGAVELLLECEKLGMLENKKDLAQSVSFTAHSGFVETLKFLEARGAPLHVVDSMGYTPIVAACRAGVLPSVKYLFNALGSQRALLERSEGDTCISTCLGGATGLNQIETMKWLIDEAKVNLEGLDHLGYTPLHIACEHGHLDAVNLLLEKGASINAIVSNVKYYPTAFLIATVNSRIPVMERLIEANPDCIYDLTQYRRNAFTSAALSGSTEAMQWLMAREKRKVTNWQDFNDGLSIMLPFALTEEGERLKKVREEEAEKALPKAETLEASSETKTKDAPPKPNLMLPALPQTINPHLASHIPEIFSEKKFEVIKFLVRSGLDPSGPVTGGNSILLYCAWCGTVELFEWLMTEGKADVTALTEKGVHVAHFAASRGDTDMMRSIAKYSYLANPKMSWDILDTSSWTPLSFALADGHLSMLDYLHSELHAPIAETKSTANLMEIAASSGSVEVLEWLEARGVPFPPHNIAKAPAPFLVALRYGKLDVVQFLHRKLKVDLLETPKVCYSWMREAMSKDFAVPLVEWLITQGLTPYHLTDNDASMVHVACSQGSLGMLRWAHRNGVSLYDICSDGNSAMTLAAHSGSRNVMHYLLSHGIPPCKGDMSHVSVTEIATRAGADEMATLLAGLGIEKP